MKKIETAPDTHDIFQKEFSLNSNLLSDPEFIRMVTDVNENYYYWDKVKYNKTPTNFSAEDVWIDAKFRRRISFQYLKMGNYLFSWYSNNKIQQLLHKFDLNMGGTMESGALIPRDDKKKYLISSIMEEAIASSQIEGAITTRKKAKEMLRKKISPRNKSEQMILNNYLSIQKILEWKKEPLTEEKLLELHKLVSNKTLDDTSDEGAFRVDDEINVVDVIDGEIVHHPPTFSELPELIEELINFFNHESSAVFIHPIIKASIVHFMIGFIHPFVDGNGRTARALFYWYLLKSGYWLTEYMSISRMILKSKTQYAKAFIYTETDDNDLTYFINYQLKQMQLAFDSLKEYIQRKIEEKRNAVAFIKLDAVNERQALILKWMNEDSSLILSVKEIETRLTISNQTARTDLEGLVALGYLESINLNKKTKAFGKADKFDSRVNESIRK